MTLVVLCLAVWTLAWLLVDGIGPGAMLSRFRQWAGVRYDDKGNRYGDNWIGELLNCEVCTSVWLSIPLSLVAYFAVWLLYPLAAIGFVILIMEWVGEDRVSQDKIGVCDVKEE